MTAAASTASAASAITAHQPPGTVPCADCSRRAIRRKIRSVKETPG